MSYLEPVEQFELSPCCKGNPKSIYYNQYNKVIQCHNCGHVYEPKATSEVYAKNITKEKINKLHNRLDKWKEKMYGE